jgi:hypothetical protein
VSDNLRTFSNLDRETIGWDHHLLHLVPTRDNVQAGGGIWTARQRGATKGVQVQITGQGRQKPTIIVPANLDDKKIASEDNAQGTIGVTESHNAPTSLPNWSLPLVDSNTVTAP